MQQIYGQQNLIKIESHNLNFYEIARHLAAINSFCAAFNEGYVNVHNIDSAVFKSLNIYNSFESEAHLVGRLPFCRTSYFSRVLQNNNF